VEEIKMKNELLENLSLLIADGDVDEALKVVDALLKEGVSPLEILDKGGTEGMNIVNQRYEDGDAFLPELVMAGDTMKEIVNSLTELMSASGVKNSNLGKVVIGQSQGDVHDIGKNLVAAMLSVNGFEVHDLGTDVSLKKFIEKATEVKADIIASSTLLTASMSYMTDIVKYLDETGMHSKHHFIIGGGPITKEYATEIKVDGWSRTAFDAVELCKRLMAKNEPGKETILVDKAAGIY
jgi:trimethylamine corrinoid protein